MNKKHINVIMYTSAFCMAYGGFFYQRYTSEPVFSVSSVTSKTHISDSLQAVSQQISLLKTSVADTRISGFSRSDKYDVTTIPGKKSTFKDNRTITARLKTKTITSFQRSASYNYTAQPRYDEQINYSMKTPGNRPAAPAFNSITNPDHTQNNGITDIQSSATSTNSFSANTSMINKNTAETASADQNLTESDGSEFLPDGSSQQDSFIARSKNPKVYTIKDYQTADISCTPGYGPPSPHAALMRGLKGC